MIDATKDIRKMEITNNIYLLAQQLFKLIQQQNIEITINQQTFQYRNTRKIPKYENKKKTENTIDKMVLKIKLAIKEPTSVTTYQELTKETWKWWIHEFPKNFYKTKQLFNTAILQQLEQFMGKNNLTTQARAIYWLHMGFQDRLEILLNLELDSITINQMGKITNTQFEELQNQIAQIILEREVQEILNDKKLELRNLRDLRDLDGAQY
ncbi:hypothetical protein G9A89_018411 [Geosiphon pyriformis]|nr:hypothetical protein G9A89_018411 [Geosiphon pyriformis]